MEQRAERGPDASVSFKAACDSRVLRPQQMQSLIR